MLDKYSSVKSVDYSLGEFIDQRKGLMDFNDISAKTKSKNKRSTNNLFVPSIWDLAKFYSLNFY